MPFQTRYALWTDLRRVHGATWQFNAIARVSLNRLFGLWQDLRDRSAHDDDDFIIIVDMRCISITGGV